MVKLFLLVPLTTAGMSSKRLSRVMYSNVKFMYMVVVAKGFLLKVMKPCILS